MALVAIVVGYVVLRLQDVLPLNPSAATPQTPDLAFNTSVSFETNTNWQNYSGETGASYLSQMTVLAVRNFTSAATGMAIAIALIRGLVRRSSKTIGNYWVDLTRGILYVLLPISVVVAVILVWQGVPQTLNGPAGATTLQGVQQTIAMGPDRLAGGHQGAGQQRRRLPERQLRPSVREPDAADQPHRDGPDVRRPVLADRHLRPIREGPAPGLGDLRGHGRHLRRRCRRRDAHPGGRQPALPGRRRPGPRQHGGHGRPERVGRWAPCSRPSRRAPAPARSTPPTTASSRSPGSCRCSTWSSARSAPAGSAPGCTGCS